MSLGNWELSHGTPTGRRKRSATEKERGSEGGRGGEGRQKETTEEGTTFDCNAIILQSSFTISLDFFVQIVFGNCSFRRGQKRAEKVLSYIFIGLTWP